jgi:serine/threonine protein phosphatase PrpC
MNIKGNLLRLVGWTDEHLSPQKSRIIESFASQQTTIENFEQIKSIQQKIMANWQIHSKVSEIMELSLKIPNAKAGQAYHAQIDWPDLNLDDLSQFELNGLQELGLAYDTINRTITGVPNQSGNFNLTLSFLLNIEPAEAQKHEKNIPFIVNPDPKSLWKTIDSNPEAIFWKPDEAAQRGNLGDRFALAGSKRGRSHAQVGSFRDDDFILADITSTGWSLAAVADGAGSASLARRGAELAVNALVDYFQANNDQVAWQAWDEIGQNDNPEANNKRAMELLSPAAQFVHTELGKAALANDAQLGDFHTTLSFCLFKKFDFGYWILSFGVGDCPIGVLDKSFNVNNLNTLDVGEYGGGTRFITMPEIFNSINWPNRFRALLVEDFEYMVLMTDGIYDPKFEVEANLEKNSAWQGFINDLHGDNAEQAKIELDAANEQSTQQILKWMDFWSPGNHDDRTLVIIF